MSEISMSAHEEFAAALAEGRLLLQRCADGHLQYPPGPACRACTAPPEGWSEASGIGVLEAFTTVHRAPTPRFAAYVPYTIGLVTLAEGPLIETWLDADPQAMRIGDAVRVTGRIRDTEAIAVAVRHETAEQGSAQ